MRFANDVLIYRGFAGFNEKIYDFGTLKNIFKFKLLLYNFFISKILIYYVKNV